MPIFDGFRRGLSLSQLLAHHIEESYNIRRPRDDHAHDHDSDVDLDEMLEMSHLSLLVPPPTFLSVQQHLYDPGERVPSYELSQEQHTGHVRMHSSRNSSASLVDTIPPIVTTTNLRRYSDSRQTRPRDRERSTTSPSRSGRKSLKTLGLKFLNARQHILLAICRDISLIPCFHGLFQAWWVFLRSNAISSAHLSITTSARMSEHFLTGVWCIVAGYLLYQVLDGLMVRWIVTYSTTGAIVRMLSMSTILIAIEEYLIATFSAEGYTYALHTWIIISCALTLLYIAQNFVTSNVDLKGKTRPRFFDFYAIAVFAVVPVGLASFFTMLGVLRSLLILRMDLDELRIRGFL